MDDAKIHTGENTTAGASKDIVVFGPMNSNSGSEPDVFLNFSAAQTELGLVNIIKKPVMGFLPKVEDQDYTSGSDDLSQRDDVVSVSGGIGFLDTTIDSEDVLNRDAEDLTDESITFNAMEEYDEFEMGVRDDLEFVPDDQHNGDSSDGVLLHDEVTQLEIDDDHGERRTPPHRRRISEISDPFEHVDGFDDGDGESDQNADDDDAEVSDPFHTQLVPRVHHALLMPGHQPFAIQVMALAAMLTVGVTETVADTASLIQQLIHRNYLHDAVVRTAFERFPRALFASPNTGNPYNNQPLPTHLGFNISSPGMYAHCLEHLHLDIARSFLDIGSGSGYMTVLAAHIMGESSISHGLELHQDIIDFSNGNLEKANQHALENQITMGSVEFLLHNVLLEPIHSHLRHGYDRVMMGLSCTIPMIRRLAQALLNPGGIMMSPCENDMVKVIKPHDIMMPLVLDVVLDSIRYSNISVPTELEERNWFAEVQHQKHEQSEGVQFLHKLWHDECYLNVPLPLVELVGQYVLGVWN